MPCHYHSFKIWRWRDDSSVIIGALTAPANHLAGFPGHTWQFMMAYNSSSKGSDKGSDILCWPPLAPAWILYTQTHMGTHAYTNIFQNQNFLKSKSLYQHDLQVISSVWSPLYNAHSVSKSLLCNILVKFMSQPCTPVREAEGTHFPAK